MSESLDAKTPAKKRKPRSLPALRKASEILGELHRRTLQSLLETAVENHAARLVITIDFPDFNRDDLPVSIYGRLQTEQAAYLKVPLPVATRYRIVEADPDGDTYTPVRDVETIKEVYEALTELRGSLERGWSLEVFGLNERGNCLGINLLQSSVRRS